MKAWILVGALLAAPMMTLAAERVAVPTKAGTTARDQQEVLSWLELQSSGAPPRPITRVRRQPSVTAPTSAT